MGGPRGRQRRPAALPPPPAPRSRTRRPTDERGGRERPQSRCVREPQIFFSRSHPPTSRARAHLPRPLPPPVPAVRMWAHTITPGHAIQSAPGVWNEDILRGMDFVLAEARKRGLKIIWCVVRRRFSPPARPRTDANTQKLSFAVSHHPVDSLRRRYRPSDDDLLEPSTHLGRTTQGCRG